MFAHNYTSIFIMLFHVCCVLLLCHFPQYLAISDVNWVTLTFCSFFNTKLLFLSHVVYCMLKIPHRETSWQVPYPRTIRDAMEHEACCIGSEWPLSVAQPWQLSCRIKLMIIRKIYFNGEERIAFTVLSSSFVALFVRDMYTTKRRHCGNFYASVFCVYSSATHWLS